MTDSMKQATVKQMCREEFRKIIKFQKPKTYAKLRELIVDEIAEHKEKLASSGKHVAAPEEDARKTGTEASTGGGEDG